ncbi:MAG: VOC family protein [Flavisolibacter sp.]|jgi:lactoylglutathione lyase
MKRYILSSLFLLPIIFARSQTTGLEHIAVYVNNLEVSTKFYKNILQLDTIPEPFHDGRHTWFSIGGKSQLHLISGAAKDIVHDKNSHLCFRTTSMDAFISRLKGAGVTYEDWPGNKQSVNTRPDGVKQIYFKDPDGWWIEINDAK